MHVTLHIRDLKLFCNLILNYFLQKHYRGFKGVLNIGIRIFFSEAQQTTNPTGVWKDVGRYLMLVLGRSTQSRACQKNSPMIGRLLYDRYTIRAWEKVKWKIVVKLLAPVKQAHLCKWNIKRRKWKSQKWNLQNKPTQSKIRNIWNTEYSRNTPKNPSKFLEFWIFLKYSIFQKTRGFSCSKFVDLFLGEENL